MKNLYLFLLFLVPYKAFLQDLTTPIKFSNITPIWNHYAIDSSRIGQENFDGTSHLIYFLQLIDENERMYIVHFDIFELYDGAFIECIDLNTGKQIWHQNTGKVLDGTKEYPNAIRINEEGYVELLSSRNTEPNGPQFGYGLCQAVIREYDRHTGELIDTRMKENPEMENKFPWYLNFNPILKLKNDEIVFLWEDVEDSTYSMYLSYYNKEFKLYKEDTISFPLKYYKSFRWYKPLKINEDTIVNIRHHSQQYPLDHTEQAKLDSLQLIMDIYDGNFNFVSSYDLAEHIPYTWEIIIHERNENDFSILCKDSIDIIGVDPYTALVIINYDGTHQETIDLKQTKFQEIEYYKLKNEDGSLIILNKHLEVGDKWYWEFYKSDGNGNLTKIKSSIIKSDEINYLLLIKCDIVDDMVLAHYMNIFNDYPNPQKRAFGTVAIDAREINLISSTYDDNDDVTGLNAQIFPNPSTGNFNLNTIELPAGSQIILRDMQGHEVHKSSVGFDERYEADMHHLPAGIYPYTISHNNVIIYEGKWVKE